MKLFLSLLAAFCLAGTASAEYLSGCWRNVRNQNLPCYIQQDGARLIFTNENGSISEGQIYGSYVVAYEWGNLRGQVVNNGNVLLWDGNGEWVRDYSCGR